MPAILPFIIIVIGVICFLVGKADGFRELMIGGALAVVISSAWLIVSFVYLGSEKVLLEPYFIADDTIQVVTYDDKVINITKKLGRMVKEGEVVEMKTYNYSFGMDWMLVPTYSIVEEKK